MKEGIAFAHEHGVRVHVTVNILAHNRDLEGVREYLKELKELGPDALIIADPAIFEMAKEICPEIERHVSTQANNTNYGTYQFWWKQGAKRVVSARELSLAEIKEIRANIPEEMELYSWSNVHFLFRKMPAEQLLYRKGCQPGSLHPSVPMEICSRRRDETW